MNALQALSAATPRSGPFRTGTLPPASSRCVASHPTESPTWLPSASAGLCPLPSATLLARGGCLEQAELAYELCGPEDAPVVAVLGGISAHRHVTATCSNTAPGWWPKVVGPGAAIDTRRLRVLSFDYLGGNGGSSGPRSRPGRAFPTVTTEDQADALAHLLDHLEIDRLAAFVGASYGGMVALSFAARHPRRLGRLIAISAADRSHPQATALRSVQRGIARLGLERGASEEALALARALAMVTYRSPAELEQRFDQPPSWDDDAATPRFPVESYLRACGERFARGFDPHAFLCLSESLDLHRVDAGSIETPATLLAVRSDQLVPPSQLTSLARRLAGPCRLVEIDSIYGHDAFLKEVELVGRLLHRSLIDLGTDHCTATELICREAAR
ncbi:MAG TPA: homoserine O-succinyltransferase [Thermoanaerobaculia bacterium]|nr:homoserine O-succinyltransferase [Thermoanaerobaculia bacterium]